MPRYINFLIVLCSAKGSAVRLNQNRICKAIVQEAPELLLRLGQRSVGGRVEVFVSGDPTYFKKVEGDPPLVTWLEGLDAELMEYLERSLALLGALVFGRNHITTKLVQEMLPLGANRKRTPFEAWTLDHHHPHQPHLATHPTPPLPPRPP